MDFSVTRCFVHIRTRDADIFRLALDLAQTPPEHVHFIENTPMFVEFADISGIRSILHAN